MSIESALWAHHYLENIFIAAFCLAFWPRSHLTSSAHEMIYFQLRISSVENRWLWKLNNWDFIVFNLKTFYFKWPTNLWQKVPHIAANSWYLIRIPFCFNIFVLFVWPNRVFLLYIDFPWQRFVATCDSCSDLHLPIMNVKRTTHMQTAYTIATGNNNETLDPGNVFL